MAAEGCFCRFGKYLVFGDKICVNQCFMLLFLHFVITFFANRANCVIFAVYYISKFGVLWGIASVCGIAEPFDLKVSKQNNYD